MEFHSLESIRSVIESSEIEAVSFDVFDTLLIRPTATETEKFGLLDKRFHELSNAGLSFARIRQMAEAQLRRKIIRGELEKEDVTIDEIYDQIFRGFSIPEETALAMKEEEIVLECRLCRGRKSGKMLFEAAKTAKKRIILLSDMYLTEAQIGHLLQINGYAGYERIFVSSEYGLRKQSGGLYRLAIQEMNVLPDRILHIGDDPENDCAQAEKNGLRSAYLPKTSVVFNEHGCAHQAEKICRDLTDWEKARKEPGISMIRQMAANLYFDDPFRPFAQDSDYNADPYFVGYAALGMEALALVRWIAQSALRDGAKKVVFLSRDGYLPMQIYDLYRKNQPELPEASYLYTSRLAMLPVMIRSDLDLYDLPVDISYQTPEKLLKLLEFCTGGDAGSEMRAICGNRKYDFGAAFTAESFEEFISDFIRIGYDAKKHEESKKRIADYLKYNKQAPLEDGTAIFDMGYSGRIASAIAEASGKQLYFYYFHADGSRQFACEKNSGIRIRTFFDFSPYMESTMREYAYLEPTASCIGYSERLEPVFDCGPALHYEETVREMQKGALDLAADFLGFFGEYEAQASFRNHNAAMPFEAFLRFCSPKDRTIYRDVMIDDELWGGRRDIGLNALMDARLRKLPDFAKDQPEEKISAENEFENKLKDTVMRESLLNWYEFKKNAHLLEIGAENGALTGLFCRRCREVTAVVFSEDERTVLLEKYKGQQNLHVILQQEYDNSVEEPFDYIVCINGLERIEDPVAALQAWKSRLKEGGKLLLGADNRFGLKYFCGCNEKYSGLPFMGVNGYFEGTCAAEPGGIAESGRMYSRNELISILDKALTCECRKTADDQKPDTDEAQTLSYQFYFPVPDSRMPQMIFGEDYRRGDDMVRLCDYNYADQEILGIEHRMWKDVIETGALPFLANSYLIEIAAPEDLSTIRYAVVTTDREPLRAMATTVRSGNIVRKRPLWQEGEKTLLDLTEKTEELQRMGVPVVECTCRTDEYGMFIEMPYIENESLTSALERFAQNDPDRFQQIFDQIYGYICTSAQDGRVYLDLAPCNAFYQGTDENGRDQILFYDQEFKEEGTPEFAMYRTLKYFFGSSPMARKIFSTEQISERYGIGKDQRELFEEKEKQFIAGVRQTGQFDWIRQASVPDYGRIRSNMKRLQTERKKPYAIGYVPGVFDLFHTGHLRLIERCKERCDYLIVGVLTDELVEFYKGRKPVIAFKDRAAVIEGLRAVDRVIAVDFDNTDKIKAWEQLHYDCHFSGDDHVGHWKDVEEELEKRGAHMEFFSYTEGISSSQIRDTMRK